MKFTPSSLLYSTDIANNSYFKASHTIGLIINLQTIVRDFPDLYQRKKSKSSENLIIYLIHMK